MPRFLRPLSIMFVHLFLQEYDHIRAIRLGELSGLVFTTTVAQGYSSLDLFVTLIISESDQYNHS